MLETEHKDMHIAVRETTPIMMNPKPFLMCHILKKERTKITKLVYKYASQKGLKYMSSWYKLLYVPRRCRRDTYV